MNIVPRIIRKLINPLIVLSLGSVALASVPAAHPGWSLDVVGTALAKSGNGNNGNGNGNGGGNSGNGGGNGGTGNSNGGGNGGTGNSNGGGNGKGNGGSSASPNAGPAGAATAPAEDGSVGASSRTLRIVHRNGITETIRAGRYEMRDARGRVIVNRPATKRDVTRLSQRRAP